MPESMRDRPTSAYEMIFLLSKQGKYFYDAEAVREKGPANGRIVQPYQNGAKNINHENRRTAGLASGMVVNGANARNVWQIPTQGRPDAHFACVDAETECLTAHGWKRHKDISDGDLAAQFDMETQTLSWGEVESVARYSVTNQEMVVCDRRDLDMWLTPNHRCVIRRRHPQTRKYLNPVIVRADELKPSHSIPTAANWLYEGVEPISSDWAELLGWYIAEGYESKHSMAVEIYQSPSANPEKTKRIEELLQRVEAEYTSATGTRKWRGMDSSCTAFRVLGYAAVRLRELSPKKAIPPDVLLWSDHLIEAILKGLIEGDGHERPDGRSVFVQKSEQAANMVQAMVLRLGMSATCSIRADGIRQVYITKHRTRSFRDSGGEYQTSRESYTGILWCPKTPNGTWVARRNGRAFITGNTFPDELPRRCILAGTSERGVCGECGAPWTRVVERTSMEIKRSERTHPMGRTRSSGTMTKPPSSKTLGWRLATLAWKMAESRRPAVRSSGREALASSPSSSTLISCVDPMSGGGIGPRKPPAFASGGYQWQGHRSDALGRDTQVFWIQVQPHTVPPQALGHRTGGTRTNEGIKDCGRNHVGIAGAGGFVFLCQHRKSGGPSCQRNSRIPSRSAVITASKKPGHKGLYPSLNAEPL